MTRLRQVAWLALVATSALAVDSMSLNDRTGVWEHWTPFAAADHPGSGAVQIGATVYGKDGGKRELPPLDLIRDVAG